MVWGRVLFKGWPTVLCARSRFVVVVCFVIAFVLFGSVVQYSESRADRAADLVPVVLPLEESVVPEVPLGEEPVVGDFVGEPDPFVPGAGEPTVVPEVVGPEGFNSDGFDKKSARVLEREEFSLTYDAGGGRRVTEITRDPVSVRVGDVWKPINTDVSGRGVFSWLGVGGAKVDEHPLGPVFAETASDKNVLTVSRGGSRIGFTLGGGAGRKVKRGLWAGWGREGGVEYEGVFPDTDLVYEVENSGVKEIFELAKKPGDVG